MERPPITINAETARTAIRVLQALEAQYDWSDRMTNHIGWTRDALWAAAYRHEANDDGLAQLIDSAAEGVG